MLKIFDDSKHGVMRLLALGPFPEFQNFQQGVSFLYKMSPYLKCIVRDGKYRSKYLVSNIKQKQYQYRMTSPSSVKHNLIMFRSKSKRETQILMHKFVGMLDPNIKPFCRNVVSCRQFLLNDVQVF